MSDERTRLAEMELAATFESRWKTLVKSSERHGVPLPDKIALWNILTTKYEQNWRCEYCNQELMIKDSKRPPLRSFSFDHIVSLFSKGDNALANIAIVCFGCNIAKGTMSHNTFTAILGELDYELVEQWKRETWAGRFANKLEREENLDNSHS